MKKGMTLKLCQLIEYFYEKIMQECALKASPRLFFNLVNNPKKPLNAKNSFKNKVF